MRRNNCLGAYRLDTDYNVNAYLSNILSSEHMFFLLSTIYLCNFQPCLHLFELFDFDQ